VTGGEALRSYGAVPQPGDDAQGMLNKIGGMAKRVDDSIQLKRQLYGLPEINLREGIRTNLNPGQDYSRDETQKSLPTGDKLKAYADQHHGGDVNKATSYLQSQGYR
jgi:hypothetical protein